MINKIFWKNKKVFLTGHTGFKGSWLSIWLSSLGANVYGYSLDPPTNPSLFDMANISEMLSMDIREDIRDLKSLGNAIKDVEPDIVIHMAAQPLVRESYIDPVGTYSTNVMGTVNILESIRNCENIRSVVIITTDKCYENKEWIWGYRENEAMGGFDPYSSSKGAAELVTNAYRRSYFDSVHTNIATARAGNVIAGGDFAKDRLIPDILASFREGKKVNIRNPNSIRPWQHVLEPLSGYLLLAEKLYSKSGCDYVGAWNFGPNESDTISVKDIVEYINQLWPESKGYTIESGQHPHEAKYLKLDTSKAKQILQWSPKWNINKTLESIVFWENDNSPIRKRCLDQIREYE